MRRQEQKKSRRDWCEENLAFELKSNPPFTRLPSLQQGGFYIQDPGTLLAVQELDPRPGELIPDSCTAPGGKATYIAQRLRNESHIVAADVSAERLKLVQENCARWGVTCVETVLLDKEIGPAAEPAGALASLPFARRPSAYTFAFPALKPLPFTP